ncbi:MAG: hypothetical protein HYU62_10730 [Caulobacterales bacterium]|nr:hypothetical protein [Caulobacterales bacterium]
MPRVESWVAGGWSLLWCASMVLPVAIVGPDPDNVFPGWLILAMGWMGVTVGQYGWFANVTLPFILLMSAMKGSPIVIRFIMIAAQLSLTLHALSWDTMYGDNGSGPIGGFGPGYYLWFVVMIGSAASLLILSVRQVVARKREVMAS